MRSRRPQQGSFAGEFDELVKHFPNDRPTAKLPPAKRTRRKRQVRTPASVNRALLDRLSS
jgi:hypothetical protein